MLLNGDNVGSYVSIRYPSGPKLTLNLSQEQKEELHEDSPWLEL